MTEPTYETPLPNYARVSGWSIAGAVGFHLLAGTVWFLISAWATLDRYLFCSDEPGWLGPLLLLMAAMWVCGAILIGWVRSRGEPVWHWTVAWWVLSTFVFMVALYSAPEPTHCGLF